MKRIVAVMAMVCSGAMSQTTRYDPAWESLDKRPTPSWYTDAKFGIFIHWGVYSVPAFGPVGKYAEWYWNALEKGPTDNGKPNPTYEFHKRVYGADFPYQNFAPMFLAEMYDPAYWAKVFSESRAEDVLLMSAKHEKSWLLH